MQRKTIPHTDLSVSDICFGTVPIGSELDEAASFRLLDRYVDLGGNFIDTALVYANWLPGIEESISEKTLGKWLATKGTGHDVVLATKGAHPKGGGPKLARLSPEEIAGDIATSLGHLRLDHIDLYWLHRDDERVPVAQVIDTLNDQVARGTIRHFACSNWRTHRIREANDYAARAGKRGFVASQVRWSLADVNPGTVGDETTVTMDAEMLEFHRETGLAAIPFSSQAKGFFSGKYRPDQDTPRKGIKRQYFSDANFARLARAQRLAKNHGASANQIALAWLLAQPFPVFPIIGSKNDEQLVDSCAACDIRLSSDEVANLSR